MARKNSPVKGASAAMKKVVLNKAVARKVASSTPVRNTAIPKVAAAKGVAGKVASSTPVRNTAIPKAATAAVAAKREITHEMIAARAFEISMGGSGGSEFDNWLRAERELRGGR